MRAIRACKCRHDARTAHNAAMNDPRILAAGATREDEAIEASIRPKRLDEYLGQAAGARADADLHRGGQAAAARRSTTC